MPSSQDAPLDRRIDTTGLLPRQTSLDITGLNVMFRQAPPTVTHPSLDIGHGQDIGGHQHHLYSHDTGYPRQCGASGIHLPRFNTRQVGLRDTCHGGQLG